MIRPIANALKTFTVLPVWQSFLIFVLACMAAVLGTWVGDVVPPVIVLNGRATPSTVPIGGSLTIHWVIERHRNCKVRRDVIMMDGKRVVWDVVSPPATSYAPLGKDEYFTAPIPLPLGFAPGPSVYRSKLQFICNPVHHLWPIIVKTEVPFEVVVPTVRQG